jgi:hypothetical protein
MGHEERMGELRNAYINLVGKPKGKRSFGRPRHRREYNIRMNIMEIWLEVVDWMYLAKLVKLVK